MGLDSNVNFLQKMYGFVFNSRFNGSFNLICRAFKSIAFKIY